MELTSNLKEIANELLSRYKETIKSSGHVASGELAETAKYKLNFDGRYVELIFNLQEYWKYLENGTKPHFPPISAIEKWLQVKRIVPTTKGGRVPTTKQLAFLIARGISKNGTKPTKLLQQTIDGSDDLIDRMVEDIKEQLLKELEEEKL